MAMIKFLDAAGKYQDDDALNDVIRYICYPNKTPSNVIGGVCVDMNDIANSMKAVSRQYNKDSRKRLVHFVVSFTSRELTSTTMARQIGYEISEYIGQRYQVVYAMHEDTIYPHLHFVFNRISYVDGSRYRGQHGEYSHIVEYVRKIVASFGIRKFYIYKYNPPVVQKGVKDLEAENE